MLSILVLFIITKTKQTNKNLIDKLNPIMEDPTRVHSSSNITSDTKGGGVLAFFRPTLTNFLTQAWCPTI